MQKYLTTVARILLSQIFLVQVAALVVSFMNNPSGYQEYQAGLGSMGLPGIFAPLIILINLVGGLGLLLGYKTRLVAAIMTVYVIALIFLLKLPLLQYLAIAGGLLLLHSNPNTACSLDNLKKPAQ